MSFIKKERGDFEVPRHKGSYSRQRLVSLKLYNKIPPADPFSRGRHTTFETSERSTTTEGGACTRCGSAATTEDSS